MYESSFGLTEAPFSISPDPRYLYMSQRHQEAMAHLRYGIQEAGGFVQLTGEVGTGKTTICRCMLEQLPDNVDVALILNPQISHGELLATLCDEIGVSYPADASPKRLLDLLNEKLIESYSQGRRTVLVIDEAQILTRDVLEQIRILTNLETNRHKLLQIILIGQPELNTTISRSELRQLSQRITARYHLEPLMKNETAEYIKYRLAVAGCHRTVFTRGAIRRVHRLSRGVPRLINVICDRAMLGAYSSDRNMVTASMVNRAGREVFGNTSPAHSRRTWWLSGAAAASLLAVVVWRPQWVPFELAVPGPVSTLTGKPSASGSGAGAPAASSRPPSGGNTAAGGGTEATDAEATARESGAVDASATAGLDIQGEKITEDIGLAGLLDQDDVALAALLNQDGIARREPQALAQLLDAWEVSPPSGDGLTCEDVESVHGLRCLRGNGGWEDLQKFNRVAALALRRDDQTAYVLLRGMRGGSVTVASRSGAYRLSRSRIDPYWSGDYVLLWRAPPRGGDAIAEDSEGVDVLWLRQALNRVPSLEPSDVDNASYDALLRKRIMTFQRTNNLQVDGRADVRTLIQLNSIVDPDVPKLRPVSPG